MFKEHFGCNLLKQPVVVCAGGPEPELWPILPQPKCSTSYPKTLGTRLRSVKIKNKDSACASTLKCEIAVKFQLNFEFSWIPQCRSWKFSAGAGVFFAGAGGGKIGFCTTLSYLCIWVNCCVISQVIIYLKLLKSWIK